MERIYLMRVFPLNLTLVDEYLLLDTVVTRNTNVPNAIFNLNASSLALVTMDLRHLLPEYRNWTYGEDWSISVNIAEEVDLKD
jgi:hypothetical protein